MLEESGGIDCGTIPGPVKNLHITREKHQMLTKWHKINVFNQIISHC